MLPLLPFAAGIVTGALALKLWRNDKTRKTLDDAGASLRKATASGLSHLETSSAAMRERLEAAEPAAKAPAPKAKAPASKAPRRRKAAATGAVDTAQTTGTPAKTPRKRATQAKANAKEGAA